MFAELIGEVTITQGGMLLLIALMARWQWAHHKECESHRRRLHEMDNKLEVAIARLETAVDSIDKRTLRRKKAS